MSKRTSEDLSNTIEVADPNNLEGGDDDTEVFEGSELDSDADEAPVTGVPWLGDINLIDFDDGTPSEVTYEVVAYLRSIQ
ncbi:hypothetical protein TrVE_jg10081 [Triparma verrucosa]|uniref:Uncharacterized protein n=1 Tax=Triparma verrucosa TaxID=1606542 RepID=A0A9W7CHH0_9STRA|nr:hypothetical protein TrVE_jg10081 [Triparma verrucosa]